ncbi:adipocyte plasma membrane-associated protein-like [Centruroides sculpturatus]|uniref:adipocyte plasma membrane-associated protein-like n=1 Tax=Centruroides sculpturatus TaxID=218467 RepID=UPI000C6E64DC|nr:adipocyte plasma membrane-associated protein-like [Centruroides sculpturatus]
MTWEEAEALAHDRNRWKILVARYEKQKAIPCSRPLGLRFDAKGTLYVADAQLGLLQVDIKKGTVTTLVSTGEKVEGKELMIPDDVDVDENGVIYFSHVSTKWKCDTFFYSMLEHENTGRYLSIESYFDRSHGMIVEFDEDGKIINSLHSPDGKSSLFSEVLEYNGYLYVGSYVNPVIIKVKQT